MGKFPEDVVSSDMVYELCELHELHPLFDLCWVVWLVFNCVHTCVLSFPHLSSYGVKCWKEILFSHFCQVSSDWVSYVTCVVLRVLTGLVQISRNDQEKMEIEQTIFFSYLAATWLSWNTNEGKHSMFLLYHKEKPFFHLWNRFHETFKVP